MTGVKFWVKFALVSDLKELKKLEGEKILWIIVLITHNLISNTLQKIQSRS
jgi:hypothetical protein